MAGNIQFVVHGTREVEKAFANVAVKVDPALGAQLRAIAKPVQQDAQNLAVANIRNIGPNWSKMKIGRRRLNVYVAERQHGKSGQTRANLFGLLMDRALVPA